jgi:hypothetical protein
VSVDAAFVATALEKDLGWRQWFCFLFHTFP